MATSLADNEEDSTLLTNVIPRERQKSNTGHQSLPSDEEDTDPDIDNDTGYDVYNDEPTDTISRKKKKKSSKDGKKYILSLTDPSDTNKKRESQYKHLDDAKAIRRRKFLYLICCLVWMVIIAGLVIFFYFYFQPQATPAIEPSPITIPENSTSPTMEPTISPIIDPTIFPTSNGTKSPTTSPTNNPSKSPTNNPTIEPTSKPSMHPTTSPTNMPTNEPTIDPTNDPSIDPTMDPTTDPTRFPTKSPSIRPSASPSRDPTSDPTNDPTKDPTSDPTTDPTVDPTFDPSSDPTHDPTIDPSQDPTMDPTFKPSVQPTTDPTISPTNDPTTGPTREPTAVPSISPSKSPSNSPSLQPTDTPSTTPTKPPSDEPTIAPSSQPTLSPVAMILQRGNTLTEEGVTMTFPENAFIDSLLTIEWGEADATTKAIFDDTTSAFLAVSIADFTGNAIHFTVENPPLSMNVVYETIIPIPTVLLDEANCPSDYGYEIFTQMPQEGFNNTIFPIFEIFESTYNSRDNTLTTELFPEMFTSNGIGGVEADIIMSCTPGANIDSTTRRLQGLQIPQIPDLQRRLLQVSDYASLCKATPIECPLEGKQCNRLKSYGRDHYGVDFKAKSENVVAAANGDIERSDTSITYEEVIVIRHDDGSATVYGNLRSRSVTVGTTVTQGEVIGVSGRTHLHFEYIPNGKIYATKKRIDVSNCIPPNPEVTPSPVLTPREPTPLPSKSPLVPPSTHPPSFEPSTSPTRSPTDLPQGSITVRDSGRLADDSFAVYIDHEFRICETEIGALNTCAINFLRPGIHNLTLEVLQADDGFGTYTVTLSDGWTFTDGGTFKDYTDLDFTPAAGWKGTWEFIVPSN